MTKRCRLWRPSSSFRGFIHNARVENAKRVKAECQRGGKLVLLPVSKNATTHSQLGLLNAIKRSEEW